MKIGDVLNNTYATPQVKQPAPPPGAKSFSETLTQAVEQVNDLQGQADALASKVAMVEQANRVSNLPKKGPCARGIDLVIIVSTTTRYPATPAN